MYIKHRVYSDERDDFKNICDFIINNNDFIANRTPWSFQRFVDWRYGLYEQRTSVEDFWSQNLILFFDALDKIIGLSICENGDETVVIMTSNRHRMLYPMMFEITTTLWPDKYKNMQTEVSEWQVSEISFLESHGFVKTDTFFKQCFDLTEPLPERQPLEDGFFIKDMKKNPSYAAQAALRASAFKGQDTLSEEALQKRLDTAYYSHQSPTYNAYTDLCIMDHLGVAVSGCEPLLNAWCGEAEIERVCTLKSHRKKGLAKRLILEALHRLKELGFEKAYITGYSQEPISLYKQLGAKEAIEMYAYEKKRDV